MDDQVIPILEKTALNWLVLSLKQGRSQE
jgi:hypothetical protein